MGYRVAPSYANICMNKHGDKLERFTSRLNIVHSTIKFTIEKSRTAVNVSASTQNKGMEIYCVLMAMFNIVEFFA